MLPFLQHLSRTGRCWQVTSPSVAFFSPKRGTRISPPTHAQRVRMNGAPGETLRLRSVQALEHPAEAGRKAATKGNIGHSSMKKVIDHDLARPNEKWLARICFPLSAEDSQDGVDAENLW